MTIPAPDSELPVGSPYPMLSAAQAARFADVALANVECEYPNKLDHVMGGAHDVQTPRALHPAFYGSFDWHSCVHMHWLLARLRRLFPALSQRAAIAAVFDRHLTPDTIAGECAYLARPEARAFERTYGWAWLLELAHELQRAADPDARRWSRVLDPLARAFVQRYLDYLPQETYPLRMGIHPNSAFGLQFAFEYARAIGMAELEALCIERTRAWYLNDRDAPAAWEPSGSDFLSPALIEAQLVCRVLPAGDFAEWLRAFLPGIPAREPASLFVPAAVSDRTDPFTVHLDGLNFSRAWCWRAIAGALPAGDARIPILNEAASAHVAAGAVGLSTNDYMSKHWLPSFATLALTA